MNTDELVEKIAAFLNPIAKDISHIKTELLHVRTAVDALKAGQDDLRAEVGEKADKADIHRVEQKLHKSNKHLQDVDLQRVKVRSIALIVAFFNRCAKLPVQVSG